MPEATRTPKQQFLDAFTQEHATTMKVLRAFPAAKGDFRPHPDSNSARDLAWTFATEQALISAAVTNTMDLSAGFPKAQGDFAAIVDKFERDFKGLVDVIKKTPDNSYNTGSVKFFVGPQTMGDIPLPAFCWFILHDQIHHRGQLSVYVRMAGGKVPAIYGPSHDEPW